MDIGELLAFGVKNGASDLHLSAGLPPIYGEQILYFEDAEFRRRAALCAPTVSDARSETLKLIEAPAGKHQQATGNNPCSQRSHEVLPLLCAGDMMNDPK